MRAFTPVPITKKIPNICSNHGELDLQYPRKQARHVGHSAIFSNLLITTYHNRAVEIVQPNESPTTEKMQASANVPLIAGYLCCAVSVRLSQPCSLTKPQKAPRDDYKHMKGRKEGNLEGNIRPVL